MGMQAKGMIYNWKSSNLILNNTFCRPDQQPYPTKRPEHTSSSSSRPPSTELTNHYGGIDYNRKQYGKPGESYNMKGDNGDRKIISESVGYHGEKITSIITELNNGKYLGN